MDKKKHWHTIIDADSSLLSPICPLFGRLFIPLFIPLFGPLFGPLFIPLFGPLFGYLFYEILDLLYRHLLPQLLRQLDNLLRVDKTWGLVFVGFVVSNIWYICSVSE